jgi:hypothetical protein
MDVQSRLMLPLAVSLAVLQACSSVDQRTDDTQPATTVENVTPVVAIPRTEASIAVPVAAVAPVPVMPMPMAVDSGKTPVSVSLYTVMPGDTLAGIAAKREVYGDARLWPLLYRANVQQIGSRGLIFPNQVLSVERHHGPDEVSRLITRPKRSLPPPALAAKPPAQVKPLETKSVENKPTTLPMGSAPKGMPAVNQPIRLSDYLNGGRQAFAAGDTPWAIYYYSIYLEQRNDDANVWGELGNIYYFDGNLPDAAKAYYNAANLLIDRGQTVRGVELIPAIEEGDPGLAEALHQRLTTVKQ